MPPQRQISTAALIALSAAAGLGAGVLIGRLWGSHLEARAVAASRALAATVHRWRDPEHWARDSTQRAAAFRRPWRVPAREVRRLQVATDCVVTIAMPDSLPAGFAWVTVRAQGPGNELLGRGGAYREEGFGAGEWVDVVLPEVGCRTIYGLGFGLSRIPRGVPISPPSSAPRAEPIAFDPVAGPD